MLETNLLLQITVVLAAAISFISILESFGFLGLSIVNKTVGFFDSSQTFQNEFSFILRLFVGGLFYTLIFFVIGSIGLLSKNNVLLVNVVFPIVVFTVGQRWRSVLGWDLKKFYLEYRWIVLGALIFLLVTFVLWFRPATNFDGVWYHIPVSKLFLQTSSIADQGKLSTYSLQPSLNYFWNLWPLSLPLSTGIASIVINTTHVFFLSLSLIFASKIGQRIWSWGTLQQIGAPILIGSTFETFKSLGVVGNDVLGTAYGLTAALFSFYILRNSKVSWKHFVYGTLLIVGLATTKFFFTIFAALLMGYFLIDSWNKLPDENNIRRRNTILLITLLILFALTFLPWIVRSYFATGRLLDPVGEPGILERTYQYVNSNPIDFWTKGIFERVNVSLIPFLTFIYSPLVLLGILIISSKDLREKVINLWVVAVFGFTLTFFSTIALGWRYYLPVVTVIVFLGVVALFKFFKETGFNLFGKILIVTVLSFFVLASIARVIYSPSDYQGLPNIVRDLYVSNFKSTDSYLSGKLVGTDYDYVQETAPEDLRSSETIFIGNTSDLLMHNLAYVKNPLIENYTFKKFFNSVKSAEDLTDKLRANSIRYVVVRRHDMGDICNDIGIRDFEKCNNPIFFQHVLHDTKWDVDWYLVTEK